MKSPETVGKSEFTPAMLMKPTIEQMFELSRIGVCMAKEQAKLRKSRKEDNAHIFLAEEHESVLDDDDWGMRYSTHKFVGRIARVDYQRWSMRIAEAFWVRGIDSEFHEVGENQDGYRVSYLFEWSRAGVMYAEKNISARYLPKVRDRVNPDIVVDNPVTIEDLAQELAMETRREMLSKAVTDPYMQVVKRQIHTVTQADCDLLIGDLSAF